MHWVGFAVGIIFIVSCSQQPPLTEIPAGKVADWPAYGATPGGTHFSVANQITTDNVHHLEVAWQHRSGDIRQANTKPGEFISQSSLQVTPIMVEDRLYYCSPFNKTFALNAETGLKLAKRFGLSTRKLITLRTLFQIAEASATGSRA